MSKRLTAQLELEVLPQPDDTTCDPTCLHAVYRDSGDEAPLDAVVAEIKPLPDGGTFAVSLACHGLHRGYQALSALRELGGSRSYVDFPGDENGPFIHL